MLCKELFPLQNRISKLLQKFQQKSKTLPRSKIWVFNMESYKISTLELLISHLELLLQSKSLKFQL